MKKLLSSLVVIAALSTGSLALAAREQGGERHPEIHQAIHSLEKAKLHLEAAQHDFGGHRKEALEACEHAIRQLRLALESDRH